MECMVYKKNSESDEWEEFEELYLETVESNEIQTFDVELAPGQTTVDPCEAIRIEFDKSSDFYGRIVIYTLEVWGTE